LGSYVTKEGTIVPNPGARPDGIADALFGRTKRSVLGLLFGRPNEWFYLREIVRLTGSGTGAIQRELAHLTKAGLIRREVRGRQVYFAANPESPVYPELRGLLAKTAGVADVLRAALRPLVDKKIITLAFIYGSVASGKHGPKSDVDLMIIGDVTLSELIPLLREAQDELGREVNPTVYGRREFQTSLRKRTHFIRSVLGGPKLMLVGTPDELARLAG
jgi:predicted nucleotidyltransferase